MKTPRIAPITLPNNPADETALPPAASAIVGDDEAFPVPVLVAAPPGTTVVLTMVDWGIKEVTDPEMKVEKLVLEGVMVLLEPCFLDTFLLLRFQVVRVPELIKG